MDGHETLLASNAHFAGDPLTPVVMERMLAGVPVQHARTGELVGEAAGSQKSTSKSAVSPRFVRQTETALADLVARGLRCDDGLLVVLDGAKALSAAVREVFGAKALVQRCTLHKRRNIADHLPDKDKAWVDAKLVKAFGHPDPNQGLRNAKAPAGLLEKNHPGAAASLREGLEEMFTVSRLGIDGRLAKTLTTSNRVESMISIARATNRNVTRWRDGQMVLRWTGSARSTPSDPSAASRATSK